MIPNLKWRVVKFHLANNQWKSFYGIRTQAKLDYLLQKYQPKNAYASLAMWLNARNIVHPNYVVADRLLLDSEILIDIDADKFQSEQEMAEEAVKIMDYMEGKYTLERAVKSGGGYHLIYHSTLSCVPDPRLRLQKHIAEKKAIYKELIDKGFKFDEKVGDIYRISRLPGTHNGNKDKDCFEVSPESLRAMTLIQSRPAEEADRLNLRGDASRDRGKALPPFAYRFLDSYVDANKSVPCILLPRVARSLEVITMASVQYGHRFYLFGLKNRVMAVSPRIVSHRRMEKILRYTKSLNLNPFLRQRHLRIRVGKMFELSPDLLSTVKEMEPAPKFLGAIGEDRKGIYSKIHIKWLCAVAPDHLMQCGENYKKMGKIKILRKGNAERT